MSDYGIQITIFEIFNNNKKRKTKYECSFTLAPLRVVVKSDIEGGELAVVTDMVVTGAMESVDNLHMEWHGVNGPGFIRTGEEAEMIDQLADAVSESPYHLQHACLPGDKSQQAERRVWPGQAGGGGGAGRRDVQRARRLPSLRRLQSPS